MKIKGIKRTFAVIRLPASDVVFGQPHSFRFESEGEVYIWKQARAQRDGDMAVFDYQDGRNGVLVKTTPSLKSVM